MKKTLKPWQHFFARRILYRGKDYEEMGLVDELKYDGSTIQAIVHGNHDYDVTINIDDGDITDMECSCPYAQDDQYCKHMAAVLYEFEYQQANDDLVLPQTSSIRPYALDFNHIIKTADPSLVESFLVELLKHDDQLTAKFLNHIHYGYTIKDLPLFTHRIDQLINAMDNYRYWDDYLDDYSYSDFIYKCRELIKQIIQSLNIQQYYGLTIACCQYFLEQLNAIDEDIQDSFDGVYKDLIDLIHEGLSYADGNTKKDILDWILEFRLISTLDFKALLENDFDKPEFIEKIKYHLLDELDPVNEEITANNGWAKPEAANILLDLTKRYPDIVIDYDGLTKRYPRFINVKLDHIVHLMEEKQYDQALQEIQTIKDVHGLTSVHQVIEPYLITIYEHNHDVLGLRDIYYKRMDNQYWLIDMDDYHRYKDTFTKDEWLNHRDEVIESLKHKENIYEVYCEERMVEPLLVLVKDSDSPYLLNKYASFLDGYNHQAILELYQYYIQKNARSAGDRSHYEELAKLLINLSKLKDGKTIANQLTNEIATVHKNRRNMIAIFIKYGLI